MWFVLFLFEFYLLGAREMTVCDIKLCDIVSFDVKDNNLQIMVWLHCYWWFFIVSFYLHVLILDPIASEQNTQSGRP